MKSVMMHCHDSTVAQNEQNTNKPLALEKAFSTATIGQKMPSAVQSAITPLIANKAYTLDH